MMLWGGTGSRERHSMTIQFDGSTACRGRNRWFQLAEGDFYFHPSDADREIKATASIWLYSKQRGKMAPILLSFSRREDLGRLVDALAQMHQAWEQHDGAARKEQG